MWRSPHLQALFDDVQRGGQRIIEHGGGDARGTCDRRVVLAARPGSQLQFGLLVHRKVQCMGGPAQGNWFEKKLVCKGPVNGQLAMTQALTRSLMRKAAVLNGYC